MFAPVETEEPDRGENMAGHNPYAPTQASLKSADTPAGTGGLWREGNCLVVARGAAFPRRCVKCNEPSEEPHKLRKVYWHHPAVYLLLLGYAILYIIVALIVRRTMEVNPGLNVEIAVHCDARGDAPANQALTQKRADAIVEYLKNKGVARNRMTAKGYGASRLLNHCAPGVQCSEEEHATNRRTEFVVTSFSP